MSEEVQKNSPEIPVGKASTESGEKPSEAQFQPPSSSEEKAADPVEVPVKKEEKKEKSKGGKVKPGKKDKKKDSGKAASGGEKEEEKSRPEKKVKQPGAGFIGLFRQKNTPEQDCLHAYAEVQMKRYKLAEKFARRALDARPNYPEALRMLVMAYRGEGQLAETELTAKAAVVSAPDNPDGHYLLGTILADLGEAEQAGENYKKAIELDPKNVAFRLDFATFLLRQRQFKSVFEMAHSVLEKDPANAKALLLKKCAEEEEWFEGVDESLYNPPMPADDRDIDIFLWLGDMYTRENYLDFALGAYQNALKIDVNNIKAKRGFATAIKLKYASYYRWLRFYSKIITTPFVSFSVLLILIVLLALSYFGTLNYTILNDINQTILAVVFFYFVIVLYTPWRNLQGCNVKTFNQYVQQLGLTPTGEPKTREAEQITADPREVFILQLEYKRKLYSFWSQFCAIFSLLLIALYILASNLLPLVIGKQYLLVAPPLKVILIGLFVVFIVLAFILYWQSRGYESE
ncbi:MAG: tetratricopeptide repeat protein [Chloroflexi bacterium]|nr:tetratricopeptide repeat protein [Chloroflexota bacterium]